METTNQQPQNEIINENSLKWLEFYIDMGLRSVIMFIIFGIGGYLLLFYALHLPRLAVFLIIFLLAIFTSPLFSRIKVSHLFMDRYKRFLNSMILKFTKVKTE